MEDQIRIQNAKIDSTMLGREDHGCMTFFLTLNYSGSCQGAGGYCLDAPVKRNGKFLKRSGTKGGMNLIMAILDVVGVEKWEDLKGKFVRARCDFGKVYAIGHITEEKWLDFAEFWNNPENKERS